MSSSLKDSAVRIYASFRHLILYGVFGALTTLVNILAYALCSKLARLDTVTSTVIAWAAAVLFAFITNKIWVFESKALDKSTVVKEAVSFFCCRLLTGVMDVLIMFVFVDVLAMNDIVIKIVSNVVVIVVNYVASKLIIFRKPSH